VLFYHSFLLWFLSPQKTRFFLNLKSWPDHYAKNVHLKYLSRGWASKNNLGSSKKDTFLSFCYCMYIHRPSEKSVKSFFNAVVSYIHIFGHNQAWLGGITSASGTEDRRFEFRQGV
jgi:hypothetical protein